MSRSEFDDPAFLDRLKQGDQTAYRQLIRRFHRSLINVAAAIIGSQAQAEEVVQDAWLAVFGSVGRFEGRSSLVTWIFAIVLNRARTRAGRESRLVALPAGLDGPEPGERGVPLSAFKPDGHWIEAPRLWDDISPERIVGGRQLWDHVQDIVAALPAAQRAVLTLRDMEGQTAEQACELLKITAENQRVLLHRARSRVRLGIDLVTGAEAPEAPAKSAYRARRAPRGNPVARRLAELVWLPAVLSARSARVKIQRPERPVAAAFASARHGRGGLSVLPEPSGRRSPCHALPPARVGAGRLRYVDGIFSRLAACWPARASRPAGGATTRDSTPRPPMLRLFGSC